MNCQKGVRVERSFLWFVEVSFWAWHIRLYESMNRAKAPFSQARWLQAERKLQQELKRIDILVTPPSWYVAQRVIPLPWIHSHWLFWLIPFLCAMFQSNRVCQKRWRWKCISRARLTGTPSRSKAKEKANLTTKPESCCNYQGQFSAKAKAGEESCRTGNDNFFCQQDGCPKRLCP